MKIYFLTYGDNKFYLSKKHIISLAKKVIISIMLSIWALKI